MSETSARKLKVDTTHGHFSDAIFDHATRERWSPEQRTEFIENIINNEIFVTELTEIEQFITNVFNSTTYVNQIKDQPGGVPALGSGGKLHPSKVEYESSILEEGGYDVTTLLGAVDVLLSLMVSRGWIASLLDRWTQAQPTVAMEKGASFINATRKASGDAGYVDGYLGGPYIMPNGNHANPILQFTGIEPGSVIRCSGIGRSTSGGGNTIYATVQSGSTTIMTDTPAFVWKNFGPAEVTIGANGQLSFGVGWNSDIAELVLENLGAP